jgi:hypothetical protein
MTSCFEGEETQKKGSVLVVVVVGKMARSSNRRFSRAVRKVREGIPKKVVGAHFCYDDWSMRPVVAGLRLFLDKEARRRFRPHYGNHEEITFKLQTFGIPTKGVPIQENGSLSVAWHHKWLQVRQAQEASESTSGGVIVPRRFDVLFGRGKGNRDHTGNMRANHLVEMHQQKRDQANKYQKTVIADRIVNIIHESHGRFLKWEDDVWSEVDHDEAREKISHLFRQLRRKKPTDQAKPQAKRVVTPRPYPVPSKQIHGIS